VNKSKVSAVPTVFNCFPKQLQPTSSKRKAPPICKAVQPEQEECNPDMADSGEDPSTVSVTSEDMDEDCDKPVQTSSMTTVSVWSHCSMTSVQFSVFIVYSQSVLDVP